MPYKLPLIKQTGWISLIPHLLVLSVVMVLASLAGVGGPALVGAVLYVFLAVLSRRILGRYHEKGMAHLKQGEFSKALENFQGSLELFRRYKWVDKWRYLTLVSPGRICYREMALLNMAYCSGQLGQEASARELYQETLAEFPESAMARAAIQVLDTLQTDRAAL